MYFFSFSLRVTACLSDPVIPHSQCCTARNYERVAPLASGATSPQISSRTDFPERPCLIYLPYLAKLSKSTLTATSTYNWFVCSRRIVLVLVLTVNDSLISLVLTCGTGTCPSAKLFHPLLSQKMLFLLNYILPPSSYAFAGVPSRSDIDLFRIKITS